MRRSTQSNKSAPAGVLIGSAEITRTTDEMESEMDVVMDAENDDFMDAKTIDENANK